MCSKLIEFDCHSYLLNNITHGICSITDGRDKFYFPDHSVKFIVVPADQPTPEESK